MVLQNLKVVQKLLILIIGALISIVVITGVFLYFHKQVMLQDRMTKTRHLVESAYGVLDYHYKKVQSGELTEAEAQEQAMRIVEGMRYEEKDYFWINDMHPVMIMHPYVKKLEGTDISDFKDPNGKRLSSPCCHQATHACVPSFHPDTYGFGPGQAAVTMWF